MESTRSSIWDNYKGILITLVVFAHFLYEFTFDPVIEIIVFLIYVFHMPAFVFASGHFTHDPPKLRKLVRAFIIFQSLYLILEFKQLGEIDIISPAYICWYLLALIVWRATARYIPRKTVVFPLLFLASVLVGFVPDIVNRFGFTRIVSFMIFFVIGLFFGDEHLIRIRKVIRPLWGVVFLAAGVTGSLIAYNFFQYKKSDMLMMQYRSLLMAPGRMVLIVLAGIISFGLLLIVSDKRSFLTKLGKNSLPIYLLHRVITFIFTDALENVKDGMIIILCSVFATVITLILLGNDPVASLFDRLLTGEDKKSVSVRRVITVSFVSMVTILFAFTSVTGMLFGDDQTAGSIINGDAVLQDPIYRVLQAGEEERLNDSVKILFAGDLILLEDQVRLAYDPETGTYDFSPMFEYTIDEISSADLAIGVYEGPSGGEASGYSTSNYGDGKYLRLNFPDEFAYAVADAGFDLVTTSNNHILDSGLDAALRTNEVLDEAGLMHIGTYADEEQRLQDRVLIVEVSGMRIAVLAYTYGSNYHTEDEFFEGEYDYLTGVIVGEDSPYYEQSLARVQDDFAYAESLDPDLIVVLPHMGTQFMLEPDAFQERWRQNFIDLGADIILGDHTHSVQPAFMEEVDGRMIFTAYCPGNYANVYREYDGDASAMIEVFVDPVTCEITGGGLIPMWTTAQADGNYRPLPVWDIMNDEDLYSSLTVDDIQRVDEVHRLITGTVMGEELSLDMAEPDYLFDQDGFMRRQCSQLILTEEMEGSEFMQTVTSADSVCFIGDSITYGTKNGGVPWYEPVESYISGQISSVSFGGWTTLDILAHADEIPEASVYVIAIGTNDLRYDDPGLGAVTAEDYAHNMEDIRTVLKNLNSCCTVIYIAPWTSFDGDLVSPLDYDEIINRRQAYTEALSQFASDNGDIFIDPNPYIDNVVGRVRQADYILDWIHPNVTNGVELYSEAVILSSD